MSNFGLQGAVADCIMPSSRNTLQLQSSKNQRIVLRDHEIQAAKLLILKEIEMQKPKKVTQRYLMQKLKSSDDPVLRRFKEETIICETNFSNLFGPMRSLNNDLTAQELFLLTTSFTNIMRNLPFEQLHEMTLKEVYQKATAENSDLRKDIRL
jgi:hypothetical protein